MKPAHLVETSTVLFTANSLGTDSDLASRTNFRLRDPVSVGSRSSAWAPWLARRGFRR